MDVVNMRVNPNIEASGAGGTPRETAVQQPRLGQDELTLSSAGALARALEQAPEARAEKVERARTLMQDKSYPPQVLIRKLAELLATRLAVGARAQAGDEVEAKNVNPANDTSDNARSRAL